MAKRKRELTHAKIERYIKEGRGQGTGKDYLPWLTIQDVPSEGRATRILGWTAERRHELLSDLERDYFYLLDYSDEVADIREQYPLLPQEETMMIAEKLGIVHPSDPKTGIPIVMTTDFLVTYHDKDFARTVKPSSKLEDNRTIEKFEIEKVYWESRGTDWGIITEQDLPYILIRNIEWIHKEYYNDDVTDIGAFAVQKLQTMLASRLQEGEILAKACLNCDQQLGLEAGTTLALFRHFLARKIWSVNMNEKIVPTKVIEQLVIHGHIQNIAKGG